ncbi:hypothetical protein FOMPIDRAFT_1056277 [Fomitopsis schrenkii]|uniref:Uncharacterized protein n=1 Tax=Fomitopsis schrenkii TaxID=2126942 RepID=S8F290_FOMSC|nr:hypothetical protein FOMPIDRAFT_1056277 [Fomitopsis schrenkii]
MTHRGSAEEPDRSRSQTRCALSSLFPWRPSRLVSLRPPLCAPTDVTTARSGHPRGPPLTSHVAPSNLPVSLHLHAAPLASLAPDAASTHLLTASCDGLTGVWDTSIPEEDKVPAEEPTQRKKRRRVAFDTNGEQAYSCGFDSTVRVWDVENGLCTNTVAASSKPFLDLALTPSATSALACSTDCTVLQYDCRAALVAGSYDGAVRLWHLRSTKSAVTSVRACVATPKKGGKVISVDWARGVVGVGSERGVEIWRVGESEQVPRNGTFAVTAPNYSRFPYTTKSLDGKEIDKHARRNGVLVEGQSVSGPRPLINEELLLTTPVGYGFSLTEKHWSTLRPLLFAQRVHLTSALEFVVEHVAPFGWNDEACVQYEDWSMTSREKVDFVDSRLSLQPISVDRPIARSSSPDDDDLQFLDIQPDPTSTNLEVNEFLQLCAVRRRAARSPPQPTAEETDRVVRYERTAGRK